MSRKKTEEASISENSDKMGLEEKLDILDKTIESMENDDITLEQAFELYQKGMSLVKECSIEINSVEGQILKISDEGETEKFD